MPTFNLVVGFNYMFTFVGGPAFTGQLLSITDGVATIVIAGVQHQINLNLVADAHLA